MKNIEEYLDNLSIGDFLQVHKEIKTFHKTGVCPPGILRTLAKMCKEITGNLDLAFAEKLILERIADMWYRQNQI
jgi:hypothetical protein